MKMRKIAAGRSVDTIACEVLWSVDEELNPLLVKGVDISDTETLTVTPIRMQTRLLGEE